jgi:membrane protein YdbS with pleckstrin-like domain
MTFAMLGGVAGFSVLGAAIFIPAALCLWGTTHILKKRTEPLTASQKKVLFIVQVSLVSLIPLTFLVLAIIMQSPPWWAFFSLSILVVSASIYAGYRQLFVEPDLTNRSS